MSHPLREDVSWNIANPKKMDSMPSHPLREDVSWNDGGGFEDFEELCHPLREDVSWNSPVPMLGALLPSHPLREDVSWNWRAYHLYPERYLSSSSWGCELKYFHCFADHSHVPSSSSWGCELKCRSCHAILYTDSHPLREDVSWNTEFLSIFIHLRCHPLREDVSWNASMIRSTLVSSSSSSWGCELKW